MMALNRITAQQPRSAAFFDIDGTLTSDNVWKGIMNFFAGRGERRLTHAAFLATHYPLAFLRKLGLMSEANFRRQWSAHLPWYYRGYDEAQMVTLTGWVAQEHVAPMTRPDTLAKLREHLDRGDAVALVSGVATPFVEAIAKLWGVPHAIGSPADARKGRYTGGMAGAPCIDEQKAIYIKEYFSRNGFNVDFASSYAYADSYSDLGMLKQVGYPVAAHPDEKLATLAKAMKWQVID